MDEQVLNVLRETLSPVEATRRNAEEQLKQLSYHPGQCSPLCHFSLRVRCYHFEVTKGGKGGWLSEGDARISMMFLYG
jgi:hypothetical protein